MSAHAYAPAGVPRHEPARQPRLFPLPGGAAAAPAAAGPPQRPSLAAVPAAAPDAAPPAHDARPGGTLDSELGLAWTALTAGAPAACIMCGGRMESHTYAAGGACTSCGTSLH